jgi:hypothetical protein
MLAAAISGLSSLLPQVNGTQPSNLTAAKPAHHGHGGGSSKLDFLLEQLQQMEASNAATSSTSMLGGTSTPGSTLTSSSGSASTTGTGAVGAGSSSNVANLEATLNQLLQNLKLSTGSTNAATNSTAAAQSSGSQHQLLFRLQQLAQQGAPAMVGRMLSAVA